MNDVQPFCAIISIKHLKLQHTFKSSTWNAIESVEFSEQLEEGRNHFSLTVFMVQHKGLEYIFTSIRSTGYRFPNYDKLMYCKDVLSPFNEDWMLHTFIDNNFDVIDHMTTALIYFIHNVFYH